MHRILLVEPNAELAETIGKYFRKNNFEISLCRDAQQAVLAADEAKPDVVVLELAISKNNGLAFLQEFHSYTDWKDVPIIIYSQIPESDVGLTDSQWEKQNIRAYLYKSTRTLANLLTSVNEVI